LEGKQRIIEALNELWTTERALIDQYVARSKVCVARGQEEIGERFSSFAFTEMREVSAILDRIIALGGIPRIQRVEPVAVGESVTEQLRLSLDYERRTIARLEETLGVCEEEKDSETVALLIEDLDREREHLAWLEEELLKRGGDPSGSGPRDEVD
jgi:bacterioferritin